MRATGRPADVGERTGGGGGPPLAGGSIRSGHRLLLGTISRRHQHRYGARAGTVWFRGYLRPLGGWSRSSRNPRRSPDGRASVQVSPAVFADERLIPGAPPAVGTLLHRTGSFGNCSAYGGQSTRFQPREPPVDPAETATLRRSARDDLPRRGSPPRPGANRPRARCSPATP